MVSILCVKNVKVRVTNVKVLAPNVKVNVTNVKVLAKNVKVLLQTYFHICTHCSDKVTKVLLLFL